MWYFQCLTRCLQRIFNFHSCIKFRCWRLELQLSWWHSRSTWRHVKFADCSGSKKEDWTLIVKALKGQGLIVIHQSSVVILIYWCLRMFKCIKSMKEVLVSVSTKIFQVPTKAQSLIHLLNEIKWFSRKSYIMITSGHWWMLITHLELCDSKWVTTCMWCI